MYIYSRKRKNKKKTNYMVDGQGITCLSCGHYQIDIYTHIYEIYELFDHFDRDGP